MKYIITGRNIEVTEGLKSAIYEKIGKLERYFTPDATVYVTLSVSVSPGSTCFLKRILLIPAK